MYLKYQLSHVIQKEMILRDTLVIILLLINIKQFFGVLKIEKKIDSIHKQGKQIQNV